MRNHTKRFRDSLLLAALLSASRPTCAQTAPAAHGATLAEAVATALRQNPDLLIVRSTVDSARGEGRIARAMPNPVVAAIPNTPYQYAATIPIDLTPQRFYRTRTANAGTAAAESDASDAARQTRLAATHAFFDALLGDAKLRIAGDRRDAVRQVLQADSARFRTGDIAEHVLARSEIELAHADADVARASVDAQAARLSLQALMGVADPDTAFKAIGTLDYRRLDAPPESLLAIAKVRRPDLVASELRVEQSGFARKNAAALLVPTPQLSYVRQYTGAFESGHYYSLGLAFELPSLNLYAGQRERAAAGAEAARFERRRSEIAVERDVTTALAEFRIQRSLVDRYQAGLLAEIDASVQAAQYAYSRGASSLLEVLDAVRAQQDARADYYTALHDYWVSAYSLNAAVATDLFGIER